MVGHLLTRLDNGIRLVSSPMRERASATVSFMFNVGSRWEEGTDAGLAHFIEHMVFKGGRRHPSARLVSEAVESVGGMLNASTDREATVFWAKVPAERLGVAVDVLADILVDPILDAAELAKERLVVVEEIRMYQDSPQDHVQTIFDEVMWPDHPLGRDVAGTEESVTAFEVDDCRRHLAGHYRPASLVVSIAGAIDPARTESLIEERLGAWRGGDGIAPPRPATPVSGPNVRLQTRRTEQAAVIIGARAPSYMDSRRYAVDILNCVLGEGMSSRLFLELREEQALAYDVSSYTVRLRDTGALCIALGCDPAKTVAAMSGAAAEMMRLASERVTDAELTKAKEYLAGRLVVQLESTSARSNFYGQQELLTEEILEPLTVIDHLMAVSADDVRDAASGILDPAGGGLRAAVVGPLRSLERLEGALRA